jgi:hypothetical protein
MPSNGTSLGDAWTEFASEVAREFWLIYFGKQAIARWIE